MPVVVRPLFNQLSKKVYLLNQELGSRPLYFYFVGQTLESLETTVALYEHKVWKRLYLNLCFYVFNHKK